MTNIPGLLFILGAAIALAGVWNIVLGGEKKEGSIIVLVGLLGWVSGVVLAGLT